MKNVQWGVAAAILSALCLMGCGSGSGNGNVGEDDAPNGGVTRALLDGGGTSSGAGVTTKNWKVVALDGNQNYPSGDGDQPCPVRLTDPNDPSQVLECGANDRVTISSDGTFTFRGFGKNWALDGERVTLDFGVAYGIQISDVTSQTVGGKQRLRILQVSLTQNGTRDSHDDGSVVVLEETGVVPAFQ